MGNDGGSYQNCRKDIVKEKPKEIKIDQNIIARNKQKLCTLTQQPLRRPIAVCRLGNLYNYEDILKALQDKTLSKKQFAHIKSFKDIKKINIKEGQSSNQNSLILCQISSQEFNGLTRFVVIFSCGCVMSEKAYNAGQNKNNNKDSKNICLVCNQPFNKNDVISLNMTPEEQQDAQEQLILNNREKKQQKLEQKQKNKQKKQEVKNNIKQEEIQQLNVDEEEKINLSKKSNLSQNKEIEQQQKKQKKIKKEESVTNSTSQQIKTEVPQSLMDKIGSGEKIEKDSQIYKSLFHKESKVEDANSLMFRNVRHGIR